MNEEEKKAIEYYQNKEVSFSVDFDTEKLLKALGITEKDSFENHQIRFKTLLNLIEKLQKENEEYSKQLDLDYVDKNYISKQKIKDEIEELKGKLEDISKRREKSKTKEEETVLWCLEIRTDERIKTLQELL